MRPAWPSTCRFAGFSRRNGPSPSVLQPSIPLSIIAPVSSSVETGVIPRPSTTCLSANRSYSASPSRGVGGRRQSLSVERRSDFQNKGTSWTRETLSASPNAIHELRSRRPVVMRRVRPSTAFRHLGTSTVRSLTLPVGSWNGAHWHSRQHLVPLPVLWHQRVGRAGVKLRWGGDWWSLHWPDESPISRGRCRGPDAGAGASPRRQLL